MSNKKKQRTSNRKSRVPVRFNDHVVSNLGQKRTENVKNVTSMETGNSSAGGICEFGETCDLGRKDRKTDCVETGNESNVGKNVQNELNGDNNASDKHDESVQIGKENKMDGDDKVDLNPVNIDNSSMNKVKLSYASVAKQSNVEVDNKLKFVPTVLTKIGKEVVVFDEELISIGSKMWQLTLCGYFVGHKMSIPELRYHLRRMWGRFGLKEVIDNGSDCWLFKFKNEEGMNLVLNQGPWMVHGRPLMLSRWDSDIGFEKFEHNKLPIWVKFTKVPMEAWSIDGLSAIASSIGIPRIMDTMTANVCQYGFGRTEYARVLIEVDAKKEFKDQIELQYRDKNQNVKGIKVVMVEYEWKPSVCNHCYVFGHDYKQCTKRTRTEEEVKEMQAAKQKENNRINEAEYKRGQYKQQWARKKDDMGGKDMTHNGKTYDEEFPTLGSKEGRNKALRKTQNDNKNSFDVVANEGNNEDNGIENNNTVLNIVFGSVGNNETLNSNDNQKCQDEGDLCRDKNGKSISMEENIVKENEDVDIFIRWQKEEEMVDMFVNNKRIPTDEELETWARYMCEWYKGKWEAKWKSKCPIVGRCIRLND